MRIVLFAVPALALAVSACASGAGPSRYESEMARLSADCEARGGILAPTGEMSGRPPIDNVCKINGGAARAGRE